VQLPVEAAAAVIEVKKNFGIMGAAKMLDSIPQPYDTPTVARYFISFNAPKERTARRNVEKAMEEYDDFFDQICVLNQWNFTTYGGLQGVKTGNQSFAFFSQYAEGS